MVSESPDVRQTGAWSPSQYLKFADHRLRPALELLDRVPLESPGTIYDLGCGAGQVTGLIADRWPQARVVGLDNSPEMLAEARAHPGRIEWLDGDIRSWVPARPPDLIYSNAALHWVEGHGELFPRLAGFLAPGGCLAVQMPLSWGLPSHRLMRETLEGGNAGGRPFGTEDFRTAAGRRWVEDAARYYAALAGFVKDLDIWETEYLQLLEGDDAVLEWVRGTGLRPILNGLGESEVAQYLDEYRRRLRQAYPPQPDGRTIYPFRRLFIVALV